MPSSSLVCHRRGRSSELLGPPASPSCRGFAAYPSRLQHSLELASKGSKAKAARNIYSFESRLWCVVCHKSYTKDYLQWQHLLVKVLLCQILAWNIIFHLVLQIPHGNMDT